MFVIKNTVNIYALCISHPYKIFIKETTTLHMQTSIICLTIHLYLKRGNIKKLNADLSLQ